MSEQGYTTESFPDRGGAFFSVEETRTTDPQGVLHVRHVVRHPGGSVAVALQDRQAVCVRQYRPAVEQLVVELPAGRHQDGEAPEATALRELYEETGLLARSATKLGSIHNAPCFCDGVSHIFLAENITSSVQHVDPDTLPKELVLVPLDELEAWTARGDLTDAKTIVALTLARAHLIGGSG